MHPDARRLSVMDSPAAAMSTSARGFERAARLDRRVARHRLCK